MVAPGLLASCAGAGENPARAMAADPDIVLVREQVSTEELARLVALHFQDMVKFVVDVEREVVALGGELHADAEQVLIEDGSSAADLWGANYYPGRGPANCIEFTALINIRPSRGNRTMTLQDPALRERVRALAFRRIGRGEPLP
jgi:hypothetical protein